MKAHLNFSAEELKQLHDATIFLNDYILCIKEDLAMPLTRKPSYLEDFQIGIARLFLQQDGHLQKPIVACVELGEMNIDTATRILRSVVHSSDPALPELEGWLSFLTDLKTTIDTALKKNRSWKNHFKKFIKISTTKTGAIRVQPRYGPER